MERAVFYARVSTEEEKQVNALVKQVEENRDVIKSKGWSLVDEYVDEGKSGTMIKRRNEYQRLLEDMVKDKFDIIVVKDQERLQRNTRDWYNFIDMLVAHDKILYFYLDNKFFNPDDDGLLTGIGAILSEQYSRNLSKKMNNSSRRRMEKAIQGEPVSAMGNGKGLGYAIINKKWVKIPEEIEVCMQIWDLYDKYDSLRKVRDEINNRGYRNSVGKLFTTESIGRVLKNEKAKGVIVMGKYHHDFNLKKIVKMPEENWTRIPAPELAYVSEERFDSVQKRLQAKTGNGRGKHIGRDPYSGKMYCNLCGSVLWRRETVRKDKNGKKKKYYGWVCSSKYAKGELTCTGVSTTTVRVHSVYQALTENIVIDKKAVKKDLLAWLNSLKATLSDNTVNTEIEKELENLERKRALLLDTYLDGLLSKADYTLKYRDLERTIEEKRNLLVPVEENADIKDIEEIISNIDNEVDEFVSTAEMEEEKISWLLDHTNRITVLENKDMIIELDLLAGVIVAGENFISYVHETLQIPHG